eukprot:9476249-Pyramimonas_sp.AAC.2
MGDAQVGRGEERGGRRRRGRGRREAGLHQTGRGGHRGGGQRGALRGVQDGHERHGRGGGGQRRERVGVGVGGGGQQTDQSEAQLAGEHGARGGGQHDAGGGGRGADPGGAADEADEQERRAGDCRQAVRQCGQKFGRQGEGGAHARLHARQGGHDRGPHPHPHAAPLHGTICTEHAPPRKGDLEPTQTLIVNSEFQTLTPTPTRNDVLTPEHRHCAELGLEGDQPRHEIGRRAEDLGTICLRPDGR